MNKLMALGIGAGLFLAACSASPDVIVQPAGEGASSPAGITVSGEGRVQGVPDTLTVNLGVSLRRDTAAQAVQDAADLADGLIASLTGQGIADEDIQTSNYSIYPEYDYINNTQKLLGFRVSNQLNVKVRDLDRAGAIFDAASASVGDEIVVNGVQFALEDNKGLLDVARAGAWDDAKAKAEQLAELAGVTLGPPTSINESVSASPPPIYYDRAMAAEAAATPIEPGQVPVSVNITVTFSVAG